MKIIAVVLLSLMLNPGAAMAEDAPIKTFESNWISQSELNSEYRRADDNRHFPYKILGKIDANGTITYKGYFTPYPPSLDYYYAYWGMNDRWYKARKTALENEGFKEIWHQSFFDSIHEEIHQAVWLRLAQTPEDNEGVHPSPKKAGGRSKEGLSL